VDCGERVDGAGVDVEGESGGNGLSCWGCWGFGGGGRGVGEEEGAVVEAGDGASGEGHSESGG